MEILLIIGPIVKSHPQGIGFKLFKLATERRTG
jgi:hypothetical protein